MNSLKVLQSGLISIYQNEVQERLVNARELHEFLESKQEFSNWIKNRIEKYGFIENDDFTTFDNFIKREGSNLGTKRTEYILKLDTAKEIAMVENNEKGRKIRKYFIEVEKRFKQKNPFSHLSKELQAIFAIDKKTQEIESRVLKLEQEDFIKPWQKKELISARTKKVLSIFGGKESQAYQDRSFRGRVYQDIFRNIKNIYSINEYDAIPKCKYEEALRLINEYTLPLELRYELEKINSQVSLREAN